MMRRIIAFITAFAVLSSAVLGSCIEPKASMVIRDTSTLCPGTYYLDDGLTIDNSSISIICNNTIIIGHDEGFGLLINSKQGVVVRNCRLKNFQVGIALTYATDSILAGNVLTDNNIGILISGSDHNRIISNIASNNSESGIVLSGSGINTIIKNKVNGSDYAIYMSSSDNNNVSRNILYGRLLGFYLNQKNTGNLMYSNDIHHTGFAAQVMEDTGNIYCIENQGNRYMDGAIGPSCNPPDHQTGQPENITDSHNVTEDVMENPADDAPESLPMPAGNSTTDNDDASTRTIELPLPDEIESLNILRKALILQGLNGTGLEDELEKKLEDFRLTKDRLHIEKRLMSDPSTDRTIISTIIRVNGEIKDLYVYEFVPKCIAQSIDNITFLKERPLSILEPDPLFVWYFPSVTEGQVLNLSYEINSKVSFTPATVAVVHGTQYVINGNSTCTRGLFSIPEGTCIESNSRLLIPFIIVPLIAFLYIYFYRFQGKRRD